MNRARFMLFLLLISAWLGAAGHRPLAAQLVPLGPEEEVDGVNFPNSVAIATQPDGSYVLARGEFEDGGYDTLSYLYVNRSDEGPEEPEAGGYLDFGTSYTPFAAAVTAGRQGFDVIWYDQKQSPHKGELPFFYRTHLNLHGMREGKPIRLGGAGTEWIWQVRGNGYMAGWSLPSKHGIAARRLTAAGQRTGPELLLNRRPIDQPVGVSVVGVTDGSFVAVWFGITPGNPGTAVVRARRFSHSGKPLGPDFDVNTIPLAFDPSLYPDLYPYPTIVVAAAPGGGLAVAWQTQPKAYLRRFNAAGTPLGPEVLAMTSGDSEDSFNPYAESLQAMAFDDAGNLALLGAGQLQLFDPRGTPQEPPVDLGSADSGRDEPDLPQQGSLAWTGDSWIAVWIAELWPYDQGTIYVRRFAER
jgi:hypothetical protein